MQKRAFMRMHKAHNNDVHLPLHHMLGVLLVVGVGHHLTTFLIFHHQLQLVAALSLSNFILSLFFLVLHQHKTISHLAFPPLPTKLLPQTLETAGLVHHLF